MNARPSHTDTELIEQARQGSHQAFKLLVERYQDQVAGVAIGMLGKTAEAEDAGQETFIRFYRSLTSFRSEASLGTYLTRIAINLCLDALKRRKKRRNEMSVQEAGPEMLRLGSEEAQARWEAREIVYRALDKLDAKSRSVILLRMIEGYSTKETAEILQVPTGTVLSRLQRGQGKLRAALGKLMEP